MTATASRIVGPNTLLQEMADRCRYTHSGLASRVNSLARERGHACAYTHTSVSNWITKGMVPKPPIPALIAIALGERLGRRVSLAEIGMPDLHTPVDNLGLDFPRDRAEALRGASAYWSHVNRRAFLSTTFAASAFQVPATRWLVQPADEPAPGIGGRRVGQHDVAELWQAADDARSWDSRFGGGNQRSTSLLEYLQKRAAPLLHGTYTQEVGSDLFAASAEIARQVGWSALDVGHHDAAQRHLIQALRLARAAGNVEFGAYVLATMALHSVLRGQADQGIDMTQGAYERAHPTAAPRVLAFVKLIEARAHGRTGDARAAAAALSRCEQLLERADTTPRDEPSWISYMTHARMSSDATEIYRDLHRPKEALGWNDQAASVEPGVFTRSVGIRFAVLGTVHLERGELDQGLALGHKAIGILGQVQSTRAADYVRDFIPALTLWKGEDRVDDFLHRVRTELAAAS